jgi:1,4-alpha-glucan branching enzyme
MTHLFVLPGFREAQKVEVAGSFNNWQYAEIFMERTKTGWQKAYHLAPGYYEYKFIVDGKWMPDPNNPQSVNSGEYENSCFVFGKNFTFRTSQWNEAKEVIVTGSFNGWRTDAHKMQRDDKGWFFDVYLAPGKYTYKFIVDGQWKLDPDNPLWEENEYGTGNSVLWVNP